jgi:hypothetical protein
MLNDASRDEFGDLLSGRLVAFKSILPGIGKQGSVA